MHNKKHTYGFFALVAILSVVIVGGSCLLKLQRSSQTDVEQSCDAGFCALPDASMDASVPHFQDAQIGDSGLAFMVGPKPDMPSICTTATSYTFTHEYTSNSTNNKITAHSQVELTDSMFNPDDIVLFAKLTYDAYERKFDVSSKATQVYFDMSLNLHAIYTKSTEDFRKVTVLHFQKGTVATIMGNDMACFRVSGEDDRFVLILEPRTYHKKLSGGSGVYLVHEMVHLASIAFNGDIDAKHENKKLWNKYDNKRSVQAIAMRLYEESLSDL